MARAKGLFLPNLKSLTWFSIGQLIGLFFNVAIGSFSIINKILVCVKNWKLFKIFVLQWKLRRSLCFYNKILWTNNFLRRWISYQWVILLYLLPRTYKFLCQILCRQKRMWSVKHRLSNSKGSYGRRRFGPLPTCYIIIDGWEWRNPRSYH